jgi:N-acetyl-beta-hexosaminidase
VDYAHSFGIKVIPEIDMPGHFCAAIAAYPELSCFERNIKVSTSFGIKFDVACIAKENTRIFIKKVLDELCDIFTDEYFHIGGDEVPSERWSLCPHCTDLKNKIGCTSWEEYQAVFMNEIYDFLTSKGKTVIMWNEHNPSCIINPNIVWQFWNASERNMAEEVSRGRKIVNSVSVPFYLDLPHSINSVRKIYDSCVIPKNCTRPDYIMGPEFPLWTELVPSQKQAEKMTFPRLICCAQKAWNDTNNLPFDDLKKQLKQHTTMLKKIGIASMNTFRTYPFGAMWLIDRIWWGRRQLYWDGLHNIIDNIRLRKIVAKKTKK